MINLTEDKQEPGVVWYQHINTPECTQKILLHTELFLGMCCMKLWLFYKGRKMSKNQGIAAAGGQVWRSFSPTSCSVQGQTRAGCSGSHPVRIWVFLKTVHSLSRQTVLTPDHLTIKRGFSINFFLIFKLIFLFFQFVSTEKHWEESGFSFFTLLQQMLMYSTGPSSNPRGAPPMSDLQQDFVLLITTLLAQQLSHFSILLTVYSSNTYFI